LRAPGRGHIWAGGDDMPTWLWVLLIVLLVLILFGGIGYRRRY
jgi:putative exporter of polyketide antibiotics